MPSVWVNTCSHVGVRGLCYHQSHANLSGLHCCLVPSGLELLPRVTSGLVALKQSGSDLMFMACYHRGPCTWGLVSHLRPCWCPCSATRVILVCISRAASVAIVMSKPTLHPRVMSGTIILRQLGSVLTSFAQDTTETTVLKPRANLSQSCPSLATATQKLGWPFVGGLDSIFRKDSLISQLPRAISHGPDGTGVEVLAPVPT